MNLTTQTQGHQLQHNGNLLSSHDSSQSVKVRGFTFNRNIITISTIWSWTLRKILELKHFSLSVLITF